MRPFLALLLPALAGAAILPDSIGPFQRTRSAPIAVADRAVWDEYGLRESESADYQNGVSKLTVAAYRLQDPTGAMAAFQWLRDAKATQSAAATLAVETASSLLLARGNYVVAFNGYKPSPAERDALLAGLRNVDTSSLPTLPELFPRANLVPNSERYIVGPASLQKFDSGIPPSVAGFHMGAEGQFGLLHGPKGDTALAVFNYPTNQMAMERVNEFAKLPGAVTKRAGPLVAVILSPPDPDEAERILSQIRYQAVVTLNQPTPTARDNIGNLVYNVFILIGFLMVFAVVSGLFVGGVRRFLLRGKKGEEAEAMISLHLENRES